MFLASLNLDLFFKKIFSDKDIAKKFLEDFFSVQITEITLLPTDKRISDDASVVKFDFRCKIDENYVVIEMQQKYKTDVNKRFYLYHSVSTALQLENLKPVEITRFTGETYTEKDYSGVEPVITLIWMVEDMLNFEDDYVAFTTLPENAKNFILDEDLWQKPIDHIVKARKKIVKILGNTTKELDFFSRNRIIYAFQKNIVKNKKNSTYFKWFEFATKSRNFGNVEEDFSEFKNDKTMAEVIERLKKDNLTTEEFNYVSDIPQWEFYVLNQERLMTIEMNKQLTEQEKKLTKKFETREKRLEKLFVQEKQKAEAEKQKAEAEKQKAEAEKQKAEAEKQKAEAEKQKAEAEKQKAEAEKQKAELIALKSIKTLLRQGFSISEIAAELEMPIDDISRLINYSPTDKQSKKD